VEAGGRYGRRSATSRLARTLLQAERRHWAALGNGPLVLAVSGGPDSLALAIAAIHVRHPLRRELIIAHFSHGLREEAEPQEAELVRRTAEAFSLPFLHERAKVPPTESKARDARYAFLARVAAHSGASAIVTAHTLNDQAETLLLRLTRGSGLRGAGAIRELSSRRVGDRELTLFRPLLGVARRDTLAVCEEAGIEPAFDASNASLQFARNRLRHRSLPELAEVNPDAVAALARFAETAQADDDLLCAVAAEAVRGQEQRGKGMVTWPTDVLRELPVPLAVRVLQSAWEHLLGERSALTQAKLEAGLRLVAGSQGGTLHLGREGRLSVEQARSTLMTGGDRPEPMPDVPLVLERETNVGDWVLQATTGKLPAGAMKGDPWAAILDLDRLGRDLLVRGRRAGDRFQPLGLLEPVRLQDVLVNAKVPRSERDALPLVEGSAGIAWVAGVQIAEWAKVTERTKQVVMLSARRRGG
jgi:tRNA(Ile)-lysidine synthase